LVGSPFVVGAGAKAVEEGVKYSIGAIATGLATFVGAMLSSHSAGEGSSKWTEEDQRLLDKLRYDESQGTLTSQQERDLEDLRDRDPFNNGITESLPTAQEIIAESKKGSIYQEFPEEFLDKTLDEINKAAKKGNKVAKKARKLITDKRFNKKDNRK